MTLDAARLRELAADTPPSPWYYRRAPSDGALILYAADDEPIAHVYAGIDTAKWICATAPAVLLYGPDT